MTEEPYRWLEAIANRREYVVDQLKGGTPVFAASLPEGILLLGVGSGNSKVFEIHDRHAMAALGHPADLERIRQSAIDAAHLEAFTRSPEDVSLRRLISFGLGPQLKQSFEQVFSAPILGEFLFVELGTLPQQDVLARVRYDGTFVLLTGRAAVAHGIFAQEAAASDWIARCLPQCHSFRDAQAVLMKAWLSMTRGTPFPESHSPDLSWLQEAQEGRGSQVIECALLQRVAPGNAKYKELTLAD